jgi:Cu/Ag efflux protein CusF
MKNSLKIAFGIVVILMISGMGQPLSAQVSGGPGKLTPRKLSSPAPATPCCGITAIDTNTGMVTAQEHATGKTFHFKVTDTAVLKSLKVGQGVYANFAASKVSVDGVAPCCNIVSAAAAPATAGTAAGAIKNKLAPLQPCCGITAIDTNTEVVTAKVNATGKAFEFKVADSALLSSLKVGQGVYANFGASQVSVDGGAPCCSIVSAAAAPATAGTATDAIKNKLAPVTPCCAITAIDSNTEVVTAKVNATGKAFEFKVADSALLNSLKVGQGVYANFAVSQVSVDGAVPCCNIVSAAAASSAATSSAAKSSATSVAPGAIQNKLAPGQPCCGITAVDTNTGVVIATEIASGQTFRFMLKDRKLEGNLHAGVPVGFSKVAGLSVKGLGPECCTPIFHHVDCSLTPSACPGGQKPKGHIQLTGSFWEDLNDFCGNTGDQIGNCVDPTQPGPNTTPPPPAPRDEKTNKPAPSKQQSSSGNNTNQRNNFGNEDSSKINASEGSTEGAIRGVTASSGNSHAGAPSYHGVLIKGVISPPSENAKGQADSPAGLRPAIQTPATPYSVPRFGSVRLASTEQGKQIIQQATAMLGGVNMHASLLGGHKYMVTSCVGIKASAGTFDLVIPDPALTFDAGGVHLTFKIARVNMDALSVRFEPNPGNLLDPCTFSDQVGIGGYVEDVQYDLTFDPVEDLKACQLGSMGKVDYKASVGNVRLEPLPPEVGNAVKDMINDALLLSYSAATQLDPVDEEMMLINRLLGEHCPSQPPH